MNYLDKHLLGFKGFKKNYLDNNIFHDILQKDREYKILSEVWESDSKNYYNMIRCVRDSFSAKISMFVLGLILVYPVISILFSGLIGLNSATVYSPIYLIISSFLARYGVIRFSKNVIPKFLYKDDERRILKIFEKTKTKKYWADFFWDDKEFKSSIKNNQVMIFTLLRKILASKEHDRGYVHKENLTNLLSNWVEKGLIKDVIFNLVEFLVYPSNMHLFSQELKKLQNKRLTRSEKNELSVLLNDSENILEKKESVSSLIENYISRLNQRTGPENINFFKSENELLRTKENTHLKVVNS